MRDRYITVFMTGPSEKEAKKIVSKLIKKKLIACGNILSGVNSIFVWRGRTDKAREVLAIMKTKKKLFKKVVLEIKGLHSYEVPEIIALPIIDGNTEYLKWIDEAVTKK